VLEAARARAQWQLNSCGDKTVAVNVRALQLNGCLYWQLFFFQYRMDFTETCVCALLLRACAHWQLSLHNYLVVLIDNTALYVSVRTSN